MAIPGGMCIHVKREDIVGLKTVASTAYSEGMLVKWSADEIVTPCTTAGEAACALCMEDLAAADNTEARTLNFALMGIVRLQAGAAVTRDGLLTPLGTGTYKYWPKVTTTGGDVIFGKVWTAQATAGSTFLAAVNFYNTWTYRTS